MPFPVPRTGSRPHSPQPSTRRYRRIGLFKSQPDLAEGFEEVLREEFAKRADADR